MENAAEALLMAAKVLIAVIILGCLLLVSNNLNNYQKTRVDDTRTKQLIEFNQTFDIYDQEDVRGSEILSLLNKAIDFNQRRANIGEEGKEVGFDPITINFDFLSKENLKILTINQEDNQLIKKPKYTQSDSNNAFNDILNRVSIIENKYGGQHIVSEICNNYTRIFLEDTATEEEKNAAVREINRIYGYSKISSYETLNNTIKKEEIQEYYEFIQFKRAHFTCVGTKYHPNKGNIIEMSFEFTGKIN